MKYTPLVARVSASVASCMLLLPAQVPLKRMVNVNVTESRGRTVTGLERDHFEILENGVRRPITGFSDGGSPLSIAFITKEALTAFGALGPDDELIQTPSASSALRQLAVSKNSRRVLVVTDVSSAPTDVPAGIQVVEADVADLVKTVTALRNQYQLEFESAGPSATIEVLLKQPAGLPPLTPHWK